MNMREQSMQEHDRSRKMGRSRLITRLREVDFSILETAEFLDTHPNNMKALRYYSKLREERERLLAEYETEVGPLTMYGNMSENEWNWIDGPWPWEGEE